MELPSHPCQWSETSRKKEVQETDPGRTDGLPDERAVGLELRMRFYIAEGVGRVCILLCVLDNLAARQGDPAAAAAVAALRSGRGAEVEERQGAARGGMVRGGDTDMGDVRCTKVGLELKAGWVRRGR